MTITIHTNIILADKGRAIGETLGRQLRPNRRCEVDLRDTRCCSVLEFTDLGHDRKITRPTEDATLEKCKAKFTPNFAAFPSEPMLPKAQPPAHLHPLQRMSSQPSAFGQSMWRPWER